MPSTPRRPAMAHDRRNFLARAVAGAGALALSACKGPSETTWFPKVLDSAENLTESVQRLFAGPKTLAPEFTKADISPFFKANGTLNPGTVDYNAAVANNFKDWKIEIGGLVEHPLKLSVAELRAMPSRTQITRHDCVEGWSCIGEWTGAPLKNVLALASPHA